MITGTLLFIAFCLVVFGAAFVNGGRTRHATIEGADLISALRSTKWRGKPASRSTYEPRITAVQPSRK